MCLDFKKRNFDAFLPSRLIQSKLDFDENFFRSETSQTGNNSSSSLFYKPYDIFWSVFAPSVVENLANINVMGKKSQKMWKIISYFVALFFFEQRKIKI